MARQGQQDQEEDAAGSRQQDMRPRERKAYDTNSKQHPVSITNGNGGGASGTGARTPLGTPASPIGVPGFRSWLTSCSSFLLLCTLGSSR